MQVFLYHLSGQREIKEMEQLRELLASGEWFNSPAEARDEFIKKNAVTSESGLCIGGKGVKKPKGKVE